MSKHDQRVLCHLITGLRHFYNYMNSVTYYFIIGHSLTYYMFLTVRISYIGKVRCMYNHILIMYSYSSMNLLYPGIGINPIGSSKLKLWHFHAN